MLGATRLVVSKPESHIIVIITAIIITIIIIIIDIKGKQCSSFKVAW